MGATKEILITEFEYRNDEAIYTMFQKNQEILAIEREGYDISLMELDTDEMTIVSEKKIQSTDVEIYIHNHFINV